MTIELGQPQFLRRGFGMLVLLLALAAPASAVPTNDDFANARQIAGIPYTESMTITGATTEPGEPIPSSCTSSIYETVWYVFTATESETTVLYIGGSYYYYKVASVYVGDSIDNLNRVACRNISGSTPLAFQTQPGQTYFIQVGNRYGGYGGTMTFDLEAAPPPVANFYTSPSQPSIFTSIRFTDSSQDPAYVGIASRSWNFGDGTSSEETSSLAYHQYAEDGVYTVSLSVMTTDGREGSTSRDVTVATHDVAISSFSVPNKARVGQTRAISVGVENSRYDEDVTVSLYRSVNNTSGSTFSWQLVGRLTQFVPLRNGNRESDFSFNYTFRSEDAVNGKVSFKAVAAIEGAPDAFAADNEVIALPTEVGSAMGTGSHRR